MTHRQREHLDRLILVRQAGTLGCASDLTATLEQLTGAEDLNYLDALVRLSWTLTQEMRAGNRRISQRVERRRLRDAATAAIARFNAGS